MGKPAVTPPLIHPGFGDGLRVIKRRNPQQEEAIAKLERLRKEGIPQTQIARMLGVERRLIGHWQDGDRKIPSVMIRAILDLRVLVAA